MSNKTGIKDRTWLDINLATICGNYAEVRKSLNPSCRIMTVLKANAYGLGALPLARALENVGCDYFGVACIEEAIALREGGVRSAIYIMGPVLPQYAQMCARMDFEIPVVSDHYAEEISNALGNTELPLKCHLKLDTGLGRLGIVVKDSPNAAIEAAKAISCLPGIRLTGICTHLISTKKPGGYEHSVRQLARFDSVADALIQRGFKLMRHCLSSEPLPLFSEHQYECVRLSGLLVGEVPVGNIRQAFSLHSRIFQIKTLPAEWPISYDALFHTLRETRIAVVPCGFGDGLFRSLSNRGYMLVRGKRAPMIGKICCDYTMLDITDIPEVHEYDVVTILGKDGQEEITPSQLAALCPASISEMLSELQPRVGRNYIETV